MEAKGQIILQIRIGKIADRRHLSVILKQFTKAIDEHDLGDLLSVNGRDKAAIASDAIAMHIDCNLD